MYETNGSGKPKYFVGERIKSVASAQIFKI